MRNVDVEAPRWIAAYEGLADSLVDGYDMSIYEYANDMSCRELLHQFADHHIVRGYEDRIAITDRKMKALLRPTKRCIHGNHPESHFWFWAYPLNSPELENDLREMGAI